MAETAGLRPQKRVYSGAREKQKIFREASRYMIREFARNDDGDGNENGKKALGLNKQSNNFARASRFLVHFSAVFARLQLETA